MSTEKCDLIVKQFLSGFPVKDIAWENLQNITWDQQEELINGTVYFKSNVTHPLRISYQKAFVKTIIDNYEADGVSVHDAVYEAYGDLVSKQELDYCFRHFLPLPDKVLTFQENVNIISEGTTGLSTWQGGIALAEWCIANAAQLKNKTIVELGAGVGLTSLIALLTCEPAKIFPTDCHESVLQNLCRNVELNLQQNSLTKLESGEVFDGARFHGTVKLDGRESLVKVVDLPWEEISEELVRKAEPDFVLAADVVYDSTLFKPLIHAFKCFLAAANCKIVLACTERNEETLNEFLNKLSDECSYRELSPPKQNVFCWSAKTKIRFFWITNK